MIRVYRRSFANWPVSWCRLADGGWLFRFFGWTIIGDGRRP
jgi:hypothetical protein